MTTIVAWALQSRAPCELTEAARVFRTKFRLLYIGILQVVKGTSTSQQPTAILSRYYDLLCMLMYGC